MKISFYPLQNGGFSPQSYSRRDSVPLDMERDWYLIEDGFAAIAREIAKAGPDWANRPAPQGSKKTSARAKAK